MAHRICDLIRSDQGLSHDEKQREKVGCKTWVDSLGNYHIKSVHHPEDGTRLFNRLDRETKRQLQKDHPKDPNIQRNNKSQRYVTAKAKALETLLTQTSSGNAVVRPVNDLSLLIDYETLKTGQLHANSVNETYRGDELIPQVIKRLACTTKITPIISFDDGTFFSAEPNRSYVPTTKQKRELRATHNTCVMAGCDQSFAECEMHHIKHWANGGETETWNLVPLCWHHHHLMHERNWKMVVNNKTGNLTTTRPDRTHHSKTNQPHLKRRE